MLAIAVAGVLDHHHKASVLNSQSVKLWYCGQRHARCDQVRLHSASVEDRWNARETGYKSSLVVIGALTLVFAAGVPYQGQLQRRWSSTRGSRSERS
jgi:hypothetical protein